jgi:poly(ADP-ribose) glycohydrolase
MQVSLTQNVSYKSVLKNRLRISSVSLDPDEDNKDKTIFEGLQLFVETILEAEERNHFLNVTVKNLAKHAKQLKQYRPARGLSFSLQQQKDTLDLELNFIAALLANAFFSTFPKRTIKTHPTLQDFNFTHFFTSLDL